MAITTRAPSRLLVLLVVMAAFSVLLLVSTVQATDQVAATGHHEVASGETLWDIAAAITSPGGDVRATVFDLKRLNRLDGAMIVPGQVLTIPVNG